MEKKVVFSEKAPAALGPYSQAMQVNGMVYTSGQLGFVPGTADLFPTVEEQTHQVFKNLQAVLEAAGTNLDKVVKTMVFLSDINDFAAVNEVYAQYFTGDFPARSCVEVSRLPKDALVEIEVIAIAE
ncbi:RidA family protein [Priestia taiwanensis]|uniref:Reactive intermediate/imine deaminase n=1 Tax=Priestia taiwanensis TaxID=1347902 RepID=A0A917AX72_9BACI|nr:RidA family protein [Priestia taiwanensis]MBM7364706.1 2-iminobutanoate/2-iminopropanoate deaminase [Priestia taiwanensis]GGE79007.1 reactive intermediate/imine deaminase [Priestia taiwanensis]